MECSLQVNSQYQPATLLPVLNLEAIASAIAHCTLNADIEAQLLFLSGQYLLVYTEDNATSYKFLSPSALREAFIKEPIDSGFLPANTIKWGISSKGEWLAQFFPPQSYQVTLTNFNNSQVTTLTIPMPALVFVGCSNKYWLWAVNKKYFDPTCQLFHVPLPNVMADGEICFGNNFPPSCSSQRIAQAWEIFWYSSFNDHVIQGKSKSYPQDVRLHLLQLHATKVKKYPLKDLVPLPNKTVNSAIRQVTL